MNDVKWILVAAALSGTLGMWLLLARSAARLRAAGIVLIAVALGLWAWQLPGLGDWLTGSLFFIFSAVTLTAAVATVVAANPARSVTWFTLTLAGSTGLFLLAGAQLFVAAAVVVLAGAVYAAFRFVLKVIRPEGAGDTDRHNREALTSAAAGVLIVAVLSTAMAGVLDAPAAELAAPVQGQPTEQTSSLIGLLFGRHLIAVEVAGVLLLAAVMGAVAIAAPDEKR